MSQQARDPCQKYACELQVCLKNNNFQENKCQNALERLVKCCSLWRQESFKVCSGIKIPEIEQQTSADSK